MANAQFIGKMAFVLTASTGDSVAQIKQAASGIEVLGKKSRKAGDEMLAAGKQLDGWVESVEGVDTGFHRAMNATESFNRKLDGSNKALRRTSNQLQQAAFAVDDFVAGFTARGLPGAIQASANNVTMLASQMNVLWGIAAVVAMAAAQIYLAFNKTKESIDDAETKLEKFSKEMDNVVDKAKERREFEIDLATADKPGDLDLPGKKKSLDLAETELKVLREKEKALAATVAQLGKAADRERKVFQPARRKGNFVRRAFDQLSEGDFRPAQEAFIDKNAELLELQTRINERLDERKNLQEQINRATKVEDRLVAEEFFGKKNEEIAKIRDKEMKQLEQILKKNNELKIDTSDAEGKIDAFINKLSVSLDEASKMQNLDLRQQAVDATLEGGRAAADQLAKELANKLPKGLGDFKTVGASSFGSVEAFSAQNKAARGNKADLQKIAEHSARAAGFLATIESKLTTVTSKFEQVN